jgi:nucleoside-diphosphate-sugar epimerase
VASWHELMAMFVVNVPTSNKLGPDDSGSAVVSVSGASGYVGRALIDSLAIDGKHPVHGLRHSTHSWNRTDVPQETRGNLLDPQSLGEWPVPGSTVVHLAYLWTAGAEGNFRATQNLMEACSRNRVRRIIHVSTAAVIGRAVTPWVDERTPCSPTTEYGKTKLRIEEILREGACRHALDLVVLRPTSVFGPGGAPLRKLADDLRSASRATNYLRSCLFGRRAMNLVHIDNVVAALRFLIDRPARFDGMCLVHSEDDEPENNFADVEATIRGRLGIPDYPIPIVALPPQLLSLTLRAMGRNIVDPDCRFRSSLIESLGFKRVRPFKEGLRDYLDWYERDVVGSATRLVRTA